MNIHSVKLFFIFSLFFLNSCDDGDIILTELDFETDDLEFCYSEASNETVFYNYNSENNEVIYLIIPGEFDEEDEENEDDDQDDGTVGSGDFVVKYLNFGSVVDVDEFFCNAVASVVTVDRELTGTDGTISIITNNTIDVNDDENSNADEDGDGLLNIDELFVSEDVRASYEEFIDEDNLIDFDLIEDEDIKDSDGDLIPDFRDQDDDNDNVNTSAELYPKDADDEDGDGDTSENLIEEDENGNTIFLDTDNDGAPDYLDEDDDGDGALTRLEFDLDISSTSPVDNVNDDGLAHYLNNEISTVGTFEEEIETLSNYNTNFETIVRVLNLTLTDNDTSITSDIRIFGEVNEIKTPQFKVYLLNDNTFRTVEIDEDTNDEIIIFQGEIGLVTDENSTTIEEEQETP